MKILLIFLISFNCFGMGFKRPIENKPPVIVKLPSQSEIENSIDKIVLENVKNYPHLMKLNSDVKHWQSVFKALAYAESSFKLNSRYVEPPSLGKDVVTGSQNTSEGLLQMSYQDSRYHGCAFDWNIDKNKDKYDLSKTIFNIENNIKCGLIVMNKLTGKKGHYIFNSGNYWAVLKTNNKRHSVYLNRFKKY